MEIDDKFINEMIELGKNGKGKNKEAIKKLETQIGMKIMVRLGSKLHLVRDELIKFVANYKNISEEEASKIDMVEFGKELMADKDFTGFLKQKLISE